MPWTLRTRRSPSTPRLRAREARTAGASSPSRSSSGCWARRRRSRSGCPARPSSACATSRPSLHHELRRARPHRAGGRLRLDRGRHRGGAHRRAFGEDDFRLATENGLTIHNPVGPDGTFDERTGPFAGMHVREADAQIIEALRESGRLFRAGRVRARLPALLALRHAADLLRQDELVRAHDRAPRRAARRQRDDRLAPGAHQARALRQVAREQRRLGASRERYWGTPLPIWRCGRRTTCASARSTRFASAGASRPTTCTGPSSTRWCSPARSAGRNASRA